MADTGPSMVPGGLLGGLLAIIGGGTALITATVAGTVRILKAVREARADVRPAPTLEEIVEAVLAAQEKTASKPARKKTTSPRRRTP